MKSSMVSALFPSAFFGLIKPAEAGFDDVDADGVVMILATELADISEAG